MARDGLKRKLTAIFHCDVVAYSRHVSGDASGTHQQLSQSLELINHEIREYGGEVIHEAGDAVLADFSSVFSAVEAAVSVQQKITVDDGNLEFRIGINLGEVIVDRDTIYGDGVNVAARLEGLADPGGICISGTVYDQIMSELDLEYEDLGPQELKNIAKPVPAYKIHVEVLSTSNISSGKIQSTRRGIAVLSFENLSNDPEQEYFSDGVSEDIISTVSRYRWLSVISRNSSFFYKGKDTDIRKIGRELGVNYVLSGSVRKAANRVRITAALTDVDTGNQIWTERYDRDLEDIFELQDELTATIAAAIEPQLARSERLRARGKTTEVMDAWDLFHQGQWHMYQFSKAHVLKAIELFENAMRFDSEFAPAYAGISVGKFVQSVAGYTEKVDETIQAALLNGEKAVALDDQDPFAYYALGRAAAISQQPKKATWALRKAIELNPSYALAYHALAQMHVMTPGNEEPSVGYIDEAIRLSPNDPLVWAFESIKAMAFFIRKEFDEALAWAEKSTQHPNAGAYSYCSLAGALIATGDPARAQNAINRVKELDSGMTLSKIEQLYPGAFPEFKTALREAGLPK